MDRSTQAGTLSELFDRLFPICRSITGEGFRKSISLLKEFIPLEINAIASGTTVFDWKIPEEWRIRSAFLEDPNGKRVVDFSESNLAVVNYSAPVDCTLTKEELLPHLHSIPHLPDATPYVTSYYERNWGFCLPHSRLSALPEGRYRAYIDSDFIVGELNYGHCLVPGESPLEVMLSSYLCHPSLANNELSGPLALVALYQRIAAWPRRRFSYRFVINPETIGSIAYLSRHGEELKKRLYSGLVLTCVGGIDQERISIKLSRKERSPINSLAQVLTQGNQAPWRVRPFDPTGGSDERQFCSPGFDLPVAQVARSVYGEYPGYHNSLDDKAFMSIDQVIRSVDEIEEMLKLLEISGTFKNLRPFGEVQLGKRGLYPNTNSANTWNNSNDQLMDRRTQLNAILTILNYSDGQHSMLDISRKSGIPLKSLTPIIQRLETEQLLIHDPRVP